MKDFTQITEFSYDMKFILFVLFGLVFTSISIILFIIFYKKSKNKDISDISLKPYFIGIILFILGSSFLLVTFSSLLSVNKQFAKYEGKFEVVKSNTNIVYANKDKPKEITIKDKNNNMQVFNVFNDEKYKKGDIVQVKITVQKGIKPSLTHKITQLDGNLKYHDKQMLDSIKKVDKK